MILTINKHEVYMKKLHNRVLHLKQPPQHRKNLHVDVLPLKRLVLSVIVQCMALVFVMQHVDVVLKSVKSKFAQ